MAATRRPKFEARKLMEQALEVMRCSIHEPRQDGRSNPMVGALLWKPDGTIETACRGEIRDGDHAEYTLLERKNRSNALDGSVLFATLEPCAPGSRRHPKLACAERIVLARIKQVWVGLADPDPTVDRKGIKYLQENGVDVQMFDRDLQEVIASENKVFIEQATERARVAAGQVASREVTLSPLEGAFEGSVLKDLSNDALEEFRSRAGISDGVTSEEFRRLLVQLGLLAGTGAATKPTGFGYLLFGKKPRTVMPQAGFLALIEYPSGATERKEFDEALVLVPELMDKWLRDKLPNILSRDQMRRTERPPFPHELVREGVVNALIHRDYEIAGAKCQLLVTEHTVSIRSPGRPPAPITVEQLQSLSAPMLSRNPPLHYVFARMALAEEQGLGIRSMRRFATSAGLPLPRYTWEPPYLVLTVFLSGAGNALAESIQVLLTEGERKGWTWLALRGQATSRQYAAAMKVDDRTARRHLNHFLELGLLVKTGSARATRYEIR